MKIAPIFVQECYYFCSYLPIVTAAFTLENLSTRSSERNRFYLFLDSGLKILGSCYMRTLGCSTFDCKLLMSQIAIVGIENLRLGCPAPAT